MEGRIIINNYIENDPLSEENLDKTLNSLHEFRLLCPNKTIWIYSGYLYEQIDNNLDWGDNKVWQKRRDILYLCDVLVDGRYIDSQRDISLKWRGSSNQRVINLKETLERGEVVLYCE